MLGGIFPALQPHQVAGPLQQLPTARKARLICEWTDHPTGLLLAAGRAWHPPFRAPCVYCCLAWHVLRRRLCWAVLVIHSVSRGASHIPEESPWCAKSGDVLLRYDLRRPGAACTPPRTLHTLQEGDAFMALAAASDPAGAAESGFVCGLGIAHLLAASTLKEVLLLDLRRPQQALLKWAHGALRVLLGFVCIILALARVKPLLHVHAGMLTKVWGASSD